MVEMKSQDDMDLNQEIEIFELEDDWLEAAAGGTDYQCGGGGFNIGCGISN
jgi:hypothetical protein